ncbi:MAG TPA: TetR/AcrR family transcriptional regulator [Pseudonocardiaceae bacterium]|jgi:AcrR family transcriptional regulator|nr:TetR/AcrR family transcriptional regulator [Pseudonocardiaceae bacterium]
MTSAPQTARGQRTRAALIDAARRVFERDGFLGARITDIADEAGVAHGTYYTYFATKEELFHVVAAAVLLRTAAEVRPIHYDNVEDAIRGIVRSTRRYLESYRRDAALITVIDQVATFDARMQEILTERSVAYIARTEAHIVALGEVAILPEGIDSYSAAVALTGMVSRYARSVFGGNPSITKRIPFEQSVRTLTVMWGSTLGLSVPRSLIDETAGRRSRPRKTADRPTR